jgi:hypothetical protein
MARTVRCAEQSALNTDGCAAAACQFPGDVRGLIGDLSSARRSRVAKHPSGLNLRLPWASFLVWNSLAHLRLPRLSRLRSRHRRDATPNAPGGYGVVRVSPSNSLSLLANATMDRSDFSPTLDGLPCGFRHPVLPAGVRRSESRRALRGSPMIPFRSSRRSPTIAAPVPGFARAVAGSPTATAVSPFSSRFQANLCLRSPSPERVRVPLTTESWCHTQVSLVGFQPTGIVRCHAHYSGQLVRFEFR